MANVVIPASDLARMSAASLANADIEKMYGIAVEVKKNPALIKEFDADPLAAAKRINGFEPPVGFHMHIVDAENAYHPKEDDALDQIRNKKGQENWIRIESRAGVGQIACIICLWCKSV